MQILTPHDPAYMDYIILGHDLQPQISCIEVSDEASAEQFICLQAFLFSPISKRFSQERF